MASFDRHIGISSGWLAASAFGLISMMAPPYLQFGPEIAALGFWVGIFLLAGTVLHLFWVSFFEKRGRHVNGPFLVMAVGLSILIVGMAWNFWPSKEAKDIQAGNNDYLPVFVECKTSSFGVANADGDLFSVRFSPQSLSSMTGGFATLRTTPNSDVSVLNQFATDIFLCNVINYGQKPIFNMYMSLRVVYNLRNKDGSVSFDKNITADQLYTVTINKIDNDKDRPFQFYVVNNSEQPGFVEILDEVKYDGEAGKPKSTGKIKQPEPRYARMLFLGNKIVR